MSTTSGCPDVQRWNLGILLVVLAAVSTLALWTLTHPQAHRAVQRTHRPSSQQNARPHPLSIGQFLVLPQRPSERVNYLISGVTPEYIGYHTQAPENFTGLTDSMMLVQLDPAANVVRLLSLPRDTRVTLADLGIHKLNAAIAQGGTAMMQSAVEQLTGLHLQGVLLINLNAVRDLTDELGGVSVYVPEAMNYDDTAAHLHIHFPAGPRVLSGAEAAVYIRFRHDALGDIGRVKRQQAFVQALGRALFSPKILLHLPGLSRVLTSDTRTDVTQADVSGALGMLLAHPKLETYLFPGSYLTQEGVSYWQPDLPRVALMMGQHFGLPFHLTAVPPLTAQEATIRVINVGTTPAVLQAAVQRLVRAGDRYVQTGAAKGVTGAPATTVLLTEGQRTLADAVRAQLGLGETRLSGEGVLGADVTIWLGADAARVLNASPPASSTP